MSDTCDNCGAQPVTLYAVEKEATVSETSKFVMIIEEWCQAAQAKIDQQQVEVEAIDKERHEIVAAITDQRDECRKLLRAILAIIDYYSLSVYFTSDTISAVRKATAGGDDE